MDWDRGLAAPAQGVDNSMQQDQLQEGVSWVQSASVGMCNVRIMSAQVHEGDSTVHCETDLFL